MKKLSTPKAKKSGVRSPFGSALVKSARPSSSRRSTSRGSGRGR